MRLLLDDDLVEGAIFHCATKRPDIAAPSIRRFHQAREGAYTVLDPDARQEAFSRVHSAFFREWGLEALLDSFLALFSGLGQHLAGAAFRKARTQADEGADLYVNAEGRRHAIIALRPERLGSETDLAPFLHHELQHVADMVDPAFGYVADLAVPGASVSQQRLVRDRYRLLWDVAIDGRLHRRGLVTLGSEPGRRAEFERAFGFLPDAGDRFEAIWGDDEPRHEVLLGIARDPRGLNDAHQATPGAPCPLCGFATFEWADLTHLSASSLTRIRREFPAWREDESICARCGDMYQATACLELPATIVF